MMFPFLKTAVTNLFREPATEAFPNPEARGLGAYRGRISFNPDSCVDCGECIKVCAPIAITRTEEAVEGGKNITRSFDLTSCTFCGTCQDFCDEGSIKLTSDYHMVAEDPADLVVSGVTFKKDIPGHIFCDLSGCIYCGLCAKNCPQNVITVDRKTKTWRINYEGCVKCGKCIEKCPKKVLSFSEEDMVFPEPQEAPAAPAKAAPARPAAPKKAAKPKNPPVYSEADGDGLVCDLANCIYCGICKKNCPADALEVDRKTKTWKVNHETCIQCGLCVDNCPKKVLSFGIPAAEEAAAEAESPAAAPAAEPAKEAGPAAEPAKAEPVKAEPAKAEETKPEGPPPEYSEAEDGDLVCHLTDCIYCGICMRNCPMEAITVDRKTKTWKVDHEKCVHCAICNDKCPKKALDFK